MDSKLTGYCILYTIFESILYDLKFDMKNIFLSSSTLRFTLQNMIVNIEIKDDQYSLSINKEELLTGEVDEDMLKSCLVKICTLFISENNVREFNNYDIFYKIVKISWFFNLSYWLYNKQLVIKNNENNMEAIITEIDDSIYHLSIGNNSKETYNTDFEYNNQLNKYSKFYDKDKTIQFAHYISRLITKEEEN